MRPQIIITDRHGTEYDATSLQVVRDGDGYGLALVVLGRCVVLELGAVEGIRVEREGSRLGPWGLPLEVPPRVEPLAVVVEGLRSGRYVITRALADEPVRPDDEGSR